MFGVHTANFEEQTGIPSVNMAVSAGIPMKFYLDSINPHLNEGDSLFLCFEYGYYTSYKWNMIGESGLNFLLYQDKSILNKVDKIELIKSIPDFVTVGWKNWENLIQEYIKNDLMNGYGVYTRNCINEQGDMVAHKGVEGEKLVANTALLDDGFHGDEVLSELKKYTENLTERGINVYMVWPPVMSEHYDSAARTLSELKQNMEDIDSVTVLGDPKEYTYAVNQFFDTNDHLTYETGIEHTQTIIDNFLEHKS